MPKKKKHPLGLGNLSEQPTGTQWVLKSNMLAVVKGFPTFTRMNLPQTALKVKQII